jgi:hypothetical protein
MSIHISQKSLSEGKPLFVVVHVDGDSVESTDAMTKEEVNNYLSDLIRVSDCEKEANKLKIFKFDWDVDQVRNDYFYYENADEEYRMEFKIFGIEIADGNK